VKGPNRTLRAVDDGDWIILIEREATTDAIEGCRRRWSESRVSITKHELRKLAVRCFGGDEVKSWPR
jgi:hypothetical protein